MQNFASASFRPTHFATSTSLPAALSWLNQTLPQRGVDIYLEETAPPSTSSSSNLVLCLANALHAILTTSAPSSAAEQAKTSRLRSDLTAALARNDRLEARVAALEREAAKAMAVAGRSREDSHDATQRILRSLEENKAETLDYKYRHQQFLHELRRRDLELEKLQDRLRVLLSSRDPTGAAVAVGGAGRGVGDAGTGTRTTARAGREAAAQPKVGGSAAPMEDQHVRAVLGAYQDESAEQKMQIRRLEERCAALEQENAELARGQGGVGDARTEVGLGGLFSRFEAAATQL